MKLTVAKSLLLTVVLSQCIACAGGAKKTATEGASQEAAKQSQTDMTRPPVTIGAQEKIVVESNPDETISFDEWKRKQEQPGSADQEPDSQSD